MTVEVECLAVQGPKVTFKVKAHDGVDPIGEGTHQRFIVSWQNFNARVAKKVEAAKVNA